MQQTNFRFINWARNITFTAPYYYQPSTESELVDIILKHNKIRFCGTGHSWSEACVTSEALVNLDKYSQVITFDEQNMLVTVQSGIKLWVLNEYLDKKGFALTNLGSIAEQSVAGAISTATHGSGINFQILASQVENFKLIKADGEIVRISKQETPDLFDQSIVTLGSLGLISELTVKVAPAFRLHETSEVVDFDYGLNHLDEWIRNTDHFKMWWFPHTDKLIIYKYNRTWEQPNDSKLRQWFMDEFISMNVYRLFLKIGTLKREWRIPINRALVNKFISPLNRIEKSYKVFNVPEPPLHRETEWAFDIKSAKTVLTEYKKLIELSDHRINFLQEIRFTKGDNFTLSPCYQRDSIWIGAYNADDYGWESLLADFEKLAMKFEGRPHWGKEFTCNGGYLKNIYPKLGEFSLLQKEWDPAGKFVNPFISKVLHSQSPNSEL